LAAVAGVEQAVVIVREDRPGDKRLVGYITGGADPAKVRSAVAERLPAYMVPTAIIALDSLPLTVNGKLDKRALPTPEHQERGQYRAPANPTEQMLADTFAEVLGVDRVGVDDSFFELGGDSLSAMRLVAAVNKGSDGHIAVRTLFEAPTVAQLSERVAAGEDATEVVPVDILKNGTGTPLCCIHDGFGLSWSYRSLAEFYDGPIIGINQIQSDGEAEPDSIHSTALRYADRIQAMYPSGPVDVLGWSIGGVIAHEVAIELRRRGCVVRRVILLDPAFTAVPSLPTRRTLGKNRILERIVATKGADVPVRSKQMVFQRAAELMEEGEDEGRELPLPLERLLEFMAHSVDANLRRLKKHRPGVFDGDVLIVAAAQGHGLGRMLPGLRAKLANESHLRRWRGHVTGEISSHAVECTHYGMLTDDSVRLYGDRL
jgi:thioesterase domain-containing protein/acyl carrier protein